MSHQEYGAGNPVAEDFALPGGDRSETSPAGQQKDRASHEIERGSVTLAGSTMDGGRSRSSTLDRTSAPSRSTTLKKKNSLSRKSSLGRSASKRSTKAVSIHEPPGATHVDHSVYHTPIPVSGSPTEVLANRFQAWRKFLKDLVGYFREVQTSYEHKSKALLKVSNIIHNTDTPTIFLAHGGINEANEILRNFHKQALNEANKARDIEQDVVTQLSGLRGDLSQKIKEIKGLSGDFKNSVEKEKEASVKAVASLQDALIAAENDPASASGKNDPYLVRLSVERQIERQIDEENYLHSAYLNIERSGRELESIVVGEIQKAYNALAGILKREADDSYDAVEALKSGPIAMARDREWDNFVEHDPHFINPKVPLRLAQNIEYPGKHHPAATEIRAGMLERKSKYLKSYTPGWYVLSPTHLHEFKSADRVYSQPPIMSLYLPEQKLGSKSQPDSSSYKFMLKGRQTGSMHRGHSWVFRAESHDTMISWYEDIKALTEKSGEERNAFVRSHARSVSGGSIHETMSSDGVLDEDEADKEPFSATAVIREPTPEPRPQRPQPGGRFPSDFQANRGSQAPQSPSSDSDERDGLAARESAPHSAMSQQLNQPEEREVNPYELSGAYSGGAVQERSDTSIGYREAQHPEASNATAYSQQQPQQQRQDPTEDTNKAHESSTAFSRQATHIDQSASSADFRHAEEPARAAPSARIMNPEELVQPQQMDSSPVASTYRQPLPSEPEHFSAPASTSEQNTFQPVSPQYIPKPSEIYQRHESPSGGEWVVPAALGAGAGAGAGVLGAEAYHQHQVRREPVEEDLRNSYLHGTDINYGPNPIMTGNAIVPEPLNQQKRTSSFEVQPDESVAGTVATHAEPVMAMDQPRAVSSETTTSSRGSTMGENHEPYLHPTGRLFPSVMRHNTDVSVSDLHVPGEYPPPTPGL